MTPAKGQKGDSGADGASGPQGLQGLQGAAASNTLNDMPSGTMADIYNTAIYIHGCPSGWTNVRVVNGLTTVGDVGLGSYQAWVNYEYFCKKL